MALSKKSDPNLAELESELKDLRSFKKGVESRSAATSKVKVFLAKLWAGPELAKSLEEWMHVRELNDSGKTITATANLIAAILRRLMRVSFVFILLASVPIILIIWQNIIMERQNQSLIKQIEAQRATSSNQQVIEYLKLLLSSDAQEVTAAKGFLVSDIVNRGIAVERLAALIKSGNSEVQCKALNAMNRIIESASDLTLKDTLAPATDERLVARDLQCPGTDFSGVDFGPMTFADVGFSHSIFKSADLSEVEFETGNLRHADFAEAHLCKDNRRCVRFLLDTDLSYSKIIFSDYNKTIFEDGIILTGAQLTFDQAAADEPDRKKGLLGTKQVTSRAPVIPRFSKENIVASGVCYESSFSQCYLFHKARDLGQLNDQKLNSLRQSNCPLNLDGPIVLTSITPCEKLGLQTPW